MQQYPTLTGMNPARRRLLRRIYRIRLRSEHQYSERARGARNCASIALFLVMAAALAIVFYLELSR